MKEKRGGNETAFSVFSAQTKEKTATTSNHILTLHLQLLCFFISTCSIPVFMLLPSRPFQLAKMLGSSYTEPSSSPTPSFNPLPSLSFAYPHEQEQGSNFNLLVTVAAIVCAVVCTLGLNTMLTCILQCANHTLRQTFQWVALRGLNSGMKKQDMMSTKAAVSLFLPHLQASAQAPQGFCYFYTSHSVMSTKAAQINKQYT
ncbi:hypothetical protein SDJN03_21510, partial [Cucurbita argyrosperma subsp. sororia]